MSNYQKEHAPIYELVYGYPESQADLYFLEVHIQEMLRGRRVLEIAAGKRHHAPGIEKFSDPGRAEANYWAFC